MHSIIKKTEPESGQLAGHIKQLGPYSKWCGGATAAKSECGKFCRTVNQLLQVNYKVWGGKGKSNGRYYKLKEI